MMLLEEWCGTFAWFEQCCSMIWRRILIFHRSSCPLSNAGENLSQIGSSPNCKKNTASAICMPNRLSNYQALKNIEAEEERFHKLLYAIFDICELADFEIEGRIVLVDKRSGKVWR